MKNRYKNHPQIVSILLFIAGVTFLFSCGDGTTTGSAARSAVVNFDRLLKCHSYSYNDGYFMTADYGCVYDPKGVNNFGNAVIYLVPQHTLNITDNQIPDATKKVNTLNIDQYKKGYNIYVFLIDKKYLTYNKNGDPVYYQKDKFTELLYVYDNASSKWNVADSININNDAAKEQSWREDFLSKVSGKPRPQVSNYEAISDKWLGIYHVDINENSSNWGDVQKISLLITKDSIQYHAEGYQIDQTYLLSGTDSGSSLKLQYKSAKDNSESAVLDKTKDFGTLTKGNNSYQWTCPYIDISFREGKSTIYKLVKQ